MAVEDILKSSELFGTLEAKYLEKISALCRTESHRQGKVIFKEGDEATDLYVVSDGRVVLEVEIHPVPDRPATPIAVEVLTRGGSFGWSAILEPNIYTLSARCTTDCTILAINGEMLRKAMADDTGLGFELAKHLARIARLRLIETRVRLTSGFALLLMGKELGPSE